MEIYSPKSRSKELFQKNRFKSEVIKEEYPDNTVEPKPVFNYQTVVPQKPNFVAEKVRHLKERLMIILELNETV